MGEKRKRSDRQFKFETTQLHGGQEQPDPSTGARSVPIYQTSSYVFDNCDHAAARFNLSDPGNIYSRLTNPTLDVFEQRMAQLEGGVAALATASGAAALSYTFQNLTRAGDHIVSSGHIYGGTYNYLAHTFPEYGVETTFVDPADLEAVEAAIRDNTKAVFIETLGNPNSDIADIERIASIAHRHQIPLVIDNTFATPYLVRPIEYGADIVVHSATKFIGGHGTAVGGVIVDGGRFDWAASKKFPGLSEPNASYHGIRFAQDVGAAAFVTRIRAILLRDTGATLSPFHGFLFLQGLETLSLRVERHVENALKVVEYLNGHPQVEAVHHPSVSRDPVQQQLYKTYFPRTAVGGVIVDGGRFDWAASKKFPGLSEPNASYHGIRFAQDVGAAAFVTRIRAILLRDTGATLSPFHGFLFLQGLETLSLRVERHVENALKVVEYLNGHPQVEAVHHPSVSRDPVQQQLYKTYFPRGGGSIFTFEIRGGAEKARKFIDNLELFSLLANVADVKSLVIHPASTTHSQMHEKELLEQGIRPGTIRLSIGTEHIDDILEDLEEAFRSV